MPYTKDDVGPRNVNGEDVILSDTERQAIADEWNADEARLADRQARIDYEKKRAIALRALQDQALAQAVADPTAPEAVRELSAMLRP